MIHLGLGVALLWGLIFFGGRCFVLKRTAAYRPEMKLNQTIVDVENVKISYFLFLFFFNEP